MAQSLAINFFLPTFLLILMWLSGTTSRTLRTSSSSKIMFERHEQWMAQFGRVYKDNAEKEKRFNIFKDNVKYIESFNADARKPYKLGINAFADLTRKEFVAAHAMCKLSSPHSLNATSSSRYENVTAIPTAVDWRKNGVVTPIKDQGSCGGCWAFSTIAATEGIGKISTGNLISLSEQELIDCNVGGQSEGCNGGFVEEAFSFIVKNGINSESKYPYTAKDGKCDKRLESASAVRISGYEKVPENEAALEKAVANQPVSVAIDASSDDFQFYSSGVFKGQCGNKNLNHAVTVVGYGATTNGVKYWIVKNSWGTSWGNGGYILMKRDIGNGGICGIALESYYPVA